MKKKITISLIVILLVTTSLPIVCSEYRNEHGDIKDEISIDRQLGWYIPFDLDKTDSKNTTNKPILMNNLPVYLSWKDINGEDWTTPSKNQGNCGSCWAFAALGALESVINIRADDPELDIDLSEQYILSCLPHSGGCDGGDARGAWYCIRLTTPWGNNCNGIIPEFCFPYQADDEVPCSNKSENWEDYLIPISDFGQWRSDGSQEDIKAIKSQILQTGPVTAVMLATRSFQAFGSAIHDPNEYFRYPGPVTGINHQVIIVGWKDDLTIDNGGYWICKNSWGVEWGYDGFFNIEYGSLNIDNSSIGWISVFPTYLNCEGNINLVDIKPGEIITGSFIVENIGSPFSNLEWEITKWPDWGDWTFTPNEGNNLIPENGSITVEVSVIVPDGINEIYHGNITVINKGFYSDYEIIPISITTLRNKQISTTFIKFLDNYPNLFPLLRQILELK